MSFQQGLSGLSAAAKSLDVIGNNVANSSTVGFKGARAEFADMYATAMAGGGASNIGIGAQLAAVSQQFTQGNISTTNNPLDLAINGGGFFRLNDNGAITYSRNGQFQLDENGYIVNAAGRQLTGYGVDASANIVQASPAALQVNTADIEPNQTTTTDLSLNLNAGATAIAVPFNANDATTYNNSTSLTMYDSLGQPHVATYYFQKTAANAWSAYLSVDGTQVDLDAGAAGNALALTFNTNGTLATPAAGTTTTAAYNPAGAAPMTLTVDVGELTQFGSPFGVNALAQNGYSSGRLVGFDIDGEGVLRGRYSNGESRNMGQLVLANFANAQGLTPLGNNEWVETTNSGPALVGVPGSASLGGLQSSALEDANIDLTAELVNMITAQRFYQANAQTVKTQDQIMQTIVNLR